jgi:hypothetical protein
LPILLVSISLAFLSGIIASGQLIVSKTLPSTGSVKTVNIEAYWDSACTQVVNQVDWGNPDPGDVVNRLIYIKNTGSTPMILSMRTSDWNPLAAGNFITLSWNIEGVLLDPNEVASASLTLTVSSQISGITTFSFNIVIEGTEQ